MKAIGAAALLLAVTSTVTPAVARAERPSAAASCKREQDLCRQMYSCRVGVGTQGADEPYYCQKCQKKLDECLRIAGLQRSVRHAPPRKKPGEVGTRAAGHELKDPKFGSRAATPGAKHKLGGVEVDEPDVPDRRSPRSAESRRRAAGSTTP